MYHFNRLDGRTSTGVTGLIVGSMVSKLECGWAYPVAPNPPWGAPDGALRPIGGLDLQGFYFVRVSTNVSEMQG
jgi:hypothetical protein